MTSEKTAKNPINDKSKVDLKKLLSSMKSLKIKNNEVKINSVFD